MNTLRQSLQTRLHANVLEMNTFRQQLLSYTYGGWFVPCRISVFSGRKREKAPRENPPNGDFFVFSHGDFSPRHTKVRDIPCVAFSATVCRIFAWRSNRSPGENPPKSPFGGFSRGDLSRFRPKKCTLLKIRHGTNQPPYTPVYCHQCIPCITCWRVIHDIVYLMQFPSKWKNKVRMTRFL